MVIRRRRRAVPVLLLGSLCALGPATFGICVPAHDKLINAFGVGGQGAWALLGACIYGYVVGLFLVDDRTPKRSTLMTALCGYTIAAITCAATADLWYFGITFFLLGICSGSIARLAIELAKSRVGLQRPALVAFIAAAISCLLAPFAGNALLRAIQWRGLLIAMAECGVFAALAVWFAVPESRMNRRVALLRPVPDKPVHNTHAPARATSKEWIGLGVIAFPCILYSMDLTVLNMTVPYLSADLHPTNTQLLWIVDIYGFMLASSLITMGTIGDRIGRRKLLLIGAGAFGVASVAAALSTSPEMLIATRALLGITGATLAPSTLSLIRNMFMDARQRTFAIGIWSISYAVGAVLGPVGGGVMLEHFWWGSVFLMAVPVMILLLITGPLLLPEFKNPNPGRLDIFSAALSLVSVLLIVYGLKHIASNGINEHSFITIGLGVVIGAYFIYRQKRITHPLIDLELFKDPHFRGPVFINTFIFFVLFGSLLFVAQYLQLVKGLSPLHAGYWTIPMASGLVVGSILGPIIVAHVKPSYVISAGFTIAAIGFYMTSRTHDAGDLMTLVTGSFVSYSGLAITITLATDMIVGAAPPDRAGAASAIAETSSEMGGSLGIAVLGAVSTSIYRTDVTNALPPNVPPEIATLSKDTFAEVVIAVPHLPEALQGPVLLHAREAFMHSLEVSTGISAGISVFIGLTTLWLLRHNKAPVGVSH